MDLLNIYSKGCSSPRVTAHTFVHALVVALSSRQCGRQHRVKRAKGTRPKAVRARVSRLENAVNAVVESEGA